MSCGKSNSYRYENKGRVGRSRLAIRDPMTCERRGCEIPTPRCFCKRVCKLLKTKEGFCKKRGKRLQQPERKRVSSIRKVREGYLSSQHDGGYHISILAVKQLLSHLDI